MELKEFVLEKWLNPIVSRCQYNLGASCVAALHMKELFELTGESLEDFMEEVENLHLHYGYFAGSPRLKKAICGLYRNATPDMVLSVHGGTGANHIAITSLVGEGDNVVSVKPSYQQHYDIPRSTGAEVRIVKLKAENDYVLDLDELAHHVDKTTKMICLSNPNNPTGVYLGEKELIRIAEIARGVGAYVLCDEIYRGADEEYMPSIVDVYEKGISTSSMSKMFSLAGTRVGWIVTPDKEAWNLFENGRSYESICEGEFNETLAAIALEHSDKILERSRKIIRENLAMLKEWIKTQPRLSLRGDTKGTTCLISYDFDIPSVEFCEDMMERTGTLVCHGDCFDEPHTFRLGFTGGDRELMTKALAGIDEYIKLLEKEGK